jgi:NAD(P)-dependent dehydrogenase (short-subunit alcohol dehydrogenase family)
MVEAGDLHGGLRDCSRQSLPRLPEQDQDLPRTQLNQWEGAMNRLDGKAALISGAARGIGAETAKLMIEAGAKVTIGDVLDERGRETARSLGDGALYHHLDVTREEDWNAAIAATVARFGGIDILVNNAGMFLGKGIEEASLDEWHRLCAINLTGVFLGTKLALPALRERAQQSPHGSAIVNLASVAGLVGSQLDPLYSMTKGGVTLFTKSAALEFARKGYRIRVNLRPITPGLYPHRKGYGSWTTAASSRSATMAGRSFLRSTSRTSGGAPRNNRSATRNVGRSRTVAVGQPILARSTWTSTAMPVCRHRVARTARKVTSAD